MRSFLIFTLTCLFLSPALPAQTGTAPPSALANSSAADDPPETVIVTYRAKAGKEGELEQLIKRHWSTIKKLGLVTGDLHVLFRGKDDSGKTFFVDIFTWKNHAAPDTAPAEVTAIWDSMQQLVEARPGHPGIEFPEVHKVKLEE